MCASGSPSAVVRMENNTLTCSSTGYPRPTILWYTCPGIHDTYVPIRLTVITASRNILGTKDSVDKLLTYLIGLAMSCHHAKFCLIGGWEFLF